MSAPNDTERLDWLASMRAAQLRAPGHGHTDEDGCVYRSDDWWVAGYRDDENVSARGATLREAIDVARHPEASPNAETLAHCGHPLDAIESGDEGTSYCRMCEEKAVVKASPTEREAT